MTILQLLNIISRSSMQLIVKLLDVNGNIGDYVFMTHDQIKKRCERHDYEIVGIRRGTEEEKAKYGRFASFVEAIEIPKRDNVPSKPMLHEVLKALHPTINVELATANSIVYDTNHPQPLLQTIEGDEIVGALKTRGINGYYIRTTTTKTQFEVIQNRKARAEAKEAARIAAAAEGKKLPPEEVVEETATEVNTHIIENTESNMVSTEEYTQKGISMYDRYSKLPDDMKRMITFSFSKDNGDYNLNMLFTACISGSIKIKDFCEILEIDNDEFYKYLHRFTQLRGKVIEPSEKELLVIPAKHQEEDKIDLSQVKANSKMTKEDRKAKFEEAARQYIAGIIDVDTAIAMSTYASSTFYTYLKAYRREHNIITASSTTSNNTTEKKEAVTMPANKTTDTPKTTAPKAEPKAAASTAAKTEPKAAASTAVKAETKATAPVKTNPPKTTANKLVINNKVLFGKCTDFNGTINFINNMITMYQDQIGDSEIIELMRKHSMVGNVYANLIVKNGNKLSTISAAEVSKTCCLDLGTMFLNGTASFDGATRQYAMNGIAELLAMNLPNINVHVDQNRKMVIRMKTDPDPAKSPDKNEKERKMVLDFIKTRCRAMEGAAVTIAEAYTKYLQFCESKKYVSKLTELQDFTGIFTPNVLATYKVVQHTIVDNSANKRGYENMIILR